MRAPLVLFTSMIAFGCSSPVAESSPAPDADAAAGSIPGCYNVVLGGRPSDDVSIPSLIELSPEPAPMFIEPGRFLVKEPGASERKAPISWWTPAAGGTLEVVLGGGYTGYSFLLRPAEQGSWSGEGTYCADFGVLPEPGPLPVRLVPRSCP
jgi:hypothetical protein